MENYCALSSVSIGEASSSVGRRFFSVFPFRAHAHSTTDRKNVIVRVHTRALLPMLAIYRARLKVPSTSGSHKLLLTMRNFVITILIEVVVGRPTEFSLPYLD